MIRLKNIVFYHLFLLTTIAIGQEANPFLQREFWKTNPSIAAVEEKIKEGHDVSQLNANSFDPVVYAILTATENSTIKYLLTKEGNGANKLTHDGRTYLFWAAYKNNLEIMEHLLQLGAKTDVIDDHGNTVLTFAAGSGQTNPQLYDFLINNGASLQETNKSGANAILLLAPSVNSLEELSYFLSKGLSLDSQDEKGNGLFNYVARTGNIKLLKELLRKGIAPTINKEGTNAMFFAAQGSRGHTNGLEVYQYLESVGVNPKATSKEGLTPLHVLAYRNQELPVFEYFLKKGIAINAMDDEGNTAFGNASGRNTLEVIQYLAEKGAEVNLQNKKGETPLMSAVANNSTEVVAYLLNQGANPQAKDQKGNTLAYYLWNSYSDRNKEPFLEKLKLLQQNGLSLERLQAGNQTPFHFASEKQSTELLKILIDLKIPAAYLNNKNNDGLTPLHLAAMKASDAAFLKALISAGADRKAITDFDETAFDLASENELLKEKKIPINFLKP